MITDLRIAIRQLRKSPVFAATAILTLAIGIGANTAIFSVMDAVVLRPLAVPDMNRVVTVYDEQDRTGDDYPETAIGKYEDWVRQSRSFEGLAIRTDRPLTLTGAGDAVHVSATAVSPNFFDLLRARTLTGRVFRADEAQPGEDREVVLTYRFWQRQFGGKPDIVGQRIELNGGAALIIGVMPKRFAFPPTADLFMPLAASPQQKGDRGARNYLVIGRLKRGVTVEAAQAEMDAIAARSAKLYPATNLGWRVKVTPLLDNINGTLTPLYMRMIMTATGFVLLIVCANLANLLFASGLSRQNEMALRTALGAQHSRLLRQLLVESVLLGLIGAGGGLLLAQFGLGILIDSMPPLIGRYVAGWSNISLNTHALVLSAVLAVAAGVISGLAPALGSLRFDLANQLKAGGRTTTSARRTHLIRNVFVVAQIALAVTLVIGATLMEKGLDAMFHRSDVYGPKRVLTFNVNLPAEHYGTRQARTAWYRDSLEKIRSLPGVKAAVVSTALPEGSDGTWNAAFQIDNRPIVPGQVQNAARLTVSTGYFSALQIPVVEGRAFDGSDGSNTKCVAIVSRNFAARYFPGTSAIGHKVHFAGAERGAEPWATIVGVAGDVQYQWTNDAPERAIYLNAAQIPPSDTKYAVMTSVDPLTIAPSVRRVVAKLDPTLPIDAVESYAEYIREGLVGLSHAATMLAMDAVVALLLAAIGIFGVMANVVGERRREIGVRLTMGATRETVVRLLLGRAAMLLGIGLAIGVPMAAMLARAVAGLLYGVRPGDIGVFAATIVTIAGITFFAAYLPARRASQLDPLELLRTE